MITCRQAVKDFLDDWAGLLNRDLFRGFSIPEELMHGKSIFYGATGELMAKALPAYAGELTATYWRVYDMKNGDGGGHA
jgi:hypothetical protein